MAVPTDNAPGSGAADAAPVAAAPHIGHLQRFARLCQEEGAAWHALQQSDACVRLRIATEQMHASKEYSQFMHMRQQRERIEKELQGLFGSSPDSAVLVQPPQPLAHLTVDLTSDDSSSISSCDSFASQDDCAPTSRKRKLAPVKPLMARERSPRSPKRAMPIPPAMVEALKQSFARLTWVSCVGGRSEGLRDLQRKGVFHVRLSSSALDLLHSMCLDSCVSLLQGPHRNTLVLSRAAVERAWRLVDAPWSDDKADLLLQLCIFGRRVQSSYEAVAAEKQAQVVSGQAPATKADLLVVAAETAGCPSAAADRGC